MVQIQSLAREHPCNASEAIKKKKKKKKKEKKTNEVFFDSPCRISLASVFCFVLFSSIFLFGLAVVCGISWARHRPCVIAATQATAVTVLDT